MQNNISHRHPANPGVLAFNLNIDNLKCQEPIPTSALQRINRASNTLASMRTGSFGTSNRQHATPVVNGRARRNPFAANVPLAVNTAVRIESKIINEQITPVLRKRVNLTESTGIHNDHIMRGVWTEYNLSLLKTLLGTSIHPGTVAKLSQQGQLQKLLIIMCNFDFLERNQKLFVFQRMKTLLSSWEGKFTSTKQMCHMQGKGLASFSRNCLRYYPRQYFSHVYDYLLHTASRVDSLYRDVIVGQLIKHFPDLCQNAQSETHFSYFKSILEASFFCSKDARCYIFNGLSKNLILLPANHAKDAAVLMESCSRKFLSKRLHQDLGKNIAYCLKEEIVHYKIDIVNSNFYSAILTTRKK